MPSSPAPPPAKAQESRDPENPGEGSLVAQQPEAPSSSSDVPDDATEKSAAKPASATAADTEAKPRGFQEDLEPRNEATEEGEAKEQQESDEVEGSSSNPPLPAGPPPTANDDGWDFHWDATHQAYFFHNRFTGQTTWNNPRIPDSSAAAAASTSSGAPGTASTASGAPGTTAAPVSDPNSIAGGYNPAIHGDYDPNAWYAQQASTPSLVSGGDAIDAEAEAAQAAAALYSTTGSFNRFSGRFQADGGAEKHSDESKSRRQLNAFFDVDAAANQHDGRSLRAERSGIKPSKAELKRFKEKRRARKEEKRRAWLKE